MSPLANALRRLLGQPETTRPHTTPGSELRDSPVATDSARSAPFETGVPVPSGPMPDGGFNPPVDSSSQPLRPVATAIEAWTRETGGWRILTTGPGEALHRAAVLLRLADAILASTELGILLVDAASTAGMAQSEPADPSELIPGRVWLVSRADYFGLEESLCRPVSRPGDTLPALVVLIDGGDWRRLDRPLWLDPRLVDALLDIRPVGDDGVDPQLDELDSSGVLTLLGSIEVPSPVGLA